VIHGIITGVLVFISFIVTYEITCRRFYKRGLNDGTEALKEVLKRKGWIDNDVAEHVDRILAERRKG